MAEEWSVEFWQRAKFQVRVEAEDEEEAEREALKTVAPNDCVDVQLAFGDILDAYTVEPE